MQACQSEPVKQPGKSLPEGEPFEGSQYLLAWAEEIVEIKTICHCGSKATMNMRIDSQGKQEHRKQIDAKRNSEM